MTSPVTAIPGLSALYAILKRGIDRKNNILVYRKELALELHDNAQKWAELLVSTFDQAIDRWSEKGKDPALDIVDGLIRDFIKVKYHSLESTSPILRYLNEDERFHGFVTSCSEFYKSALSVKRLVYGTIEAHPGQYISARDAGIRKMVQLWLSEVESRLIRVQHEYMHVLTIEPK